MSSNNARETAQAMVRIGAELGADVFQVIAATRRSLNAAIETGDDTVDFDPVYDELVKIGKATRIALALTSDPSKENSDAA